MTIGTIMLLGFGLGALLIAGGTSREEPSPTSLNDQLRARAIEAQKTSARAALRARELTARWLEYDQQK